MQPLIFVRPIYFYSKCLRVCLNLLDLRLTHRVPKTPLAALTHFWCLIFQKQLPSSLLEQQQQALLEFGPIPRQASEPCF